MHRPATLRLASILAALALFAGCDLAEDDFQPEVVVEAFLTAGEPLPTIRLSTTAPIDVPYSFDAYALSDAEVELVLLGEGAGDDEEAVFFYREQIGLDDRDDFPGNYIPDDAERRANDVIPGRRYRLVVRVPDRPDLLAAGEAIRAETVVPDTFQILVPPPDTIRYNILAPSPAIDVTRSVNAQRQGVFIFNIEALDPDGYALTPTIRQFVEDSDDLSADDFVQTSSPVLNEGNYEVLPSGALRLRVPWFAIAYYGPNLFSANALDDALYDFLRSRDAQFNPTTLSPGEIQRVLSNVENGAGVFGSLATVRTRVFVAE